MLKLRSLKIAAVLVVCLIPIFAISCKKSSNGDPNSKRLVIAVIPKGTIHEFWKSVHAGALMAAKESNVDIIWKGPLKEDDRESQIAVVENMITRGVSGIVLAPLDDTALRSPVLSAQRAGIPVVIFDSGLKGNDYVSYVATDNFKGGQTAGEYMGRVLGGKGRVAVLRYSEGSDSTTQRENGFLDAIGKVGGIEVISSNQYAGVTTESALKAAENLFSRFRNADGSLQIDGIFCAAEAPTLGVLLALENIGAAGKMKFLGFDTSAKMVDALRKGHLNGFVVQDPVKIGYLGVKTIASHIRGEKVESRIDTGSTLITGENIDDPAIQKLLNPDVEKILNQ